MTKGFLSIALSAMLILTACDTLNSAGQKETIGALGGAVAGGLAGSAIGGGSGQLVAVGVGTLLGGLIGGEIGRSLDKADMLYAQRANQQAHSAAIGETISWNNPESGNSGTVIPVRDGFADNGNYCREYEQTIYVDGQQETGTGIACRQADGTWRISG